MKICAVLFYPLFRWARLACLVGMGLALAASPAFATDPADVATGLKSLLALTTKPTGLSMVAILYNAHDPDSQADADAIAKGINNGSIAVPGLKLIAQSMTVASFSWIANPKAAFLAQGIPADSFPSIARVSAMTGALTIATDPACVTAHACVLGVVTHPTVEMYYSPDAAEDARLSFTPAFIMLANQV